MELWKHSSFVLVGTGGEVTLICIMFGNDNVYLLYVISSVGNTIKLLNTEAGAQLDIIFEKSSCQVSRFQAVTIVHVFIYEGFLQMLWTSIYYNLAYIRKDYLGWNDGNGNRTGYQVPKVSSQWPLAIKAQENLVDWRHHLHWGQSVNLHSIHWPKNQWDLPLGGIFFFACTSAPSPHLRQSTLYLWQFAGGCIAALAHYECLSGHSSPLRSSWSNTGHVAGYAVARSPAWLKYIRSLCRRPDISDVLNAHVYFSACRRGRKHVSL